MVIRFYLQIQINKIKFPTLKFKLINNLNKNYLIK